MSEPGRSLDRLAKRFGPGALAAADYPRQGFHHRLALGGDYLRELAGIMAEEGFYLEYLTAVDRGPRLELVYVYNRLDRLQRLIAAAAVRKGVAVPSIARVFASADWMEREVYDLFGQRFIGHPNLRRILLPEDADFHPLLKDFRAGAAHGGETVKLEAR
jgi:NADH-quinone oxidoreductase subunit C